MFGHCIACAPASRLSARANTGKNAEGPDMLTHPKVNFWTKPALRMRIHCKGAQGPKANTKLLYSTVVRIFKL